MSARLLRVLVLHGLVAVAAYADGPPAVRTVLVPHDGHRPQAVVDGRGAVHVVQGSTAQRGDLYYLRRAAGEEFSAPIKVNTAEGISAGHAMAVGADGRVHVLIRPSPAYLKLKKPEKAKLNFWDLEYMLYCRLSDDGKSFEEERDLSGPTLGMEGVGAVVAEGDNRVYAFWHGQLEPRANEPGRKIWRVASEDGGRTFSEPVAVTCEVEGACQCCPIAASQLPDGRIALAFRNTRRLAVDSVTKDSYLLLSKDRGQSFSATLLEPWLMAGCPGSQYALALGPAGLIVGWRTRGAVKFAREAAPTTAASPTEGEGTRAITLACNKDGVTLCAWVAVSGKGGDAVWQLFDGSGAPMGERHVVANAAVIPWGGLAAIALPDGSFELLHDGPPGK